MRIRKNAKLSPLLFYSSSSSSQGGSVIPVETFQTHVCQLNQSPWDVIPFDSDLLQFEGEDSFTGNGSAGDSVGAVESVASMMDAEEKSLLNMMVDDNHDEMKANGDGEEQKSIPWNKSDDKSYLCKNEAKEAQSFCDYDNSASYNTHSSKKVAAAAGVRRARARAAKKTPPSSNPNEFYYYSGFGPLWGKRRGDRSGEANKNVGGNQNSTMAEEASAEAAGYNNNNNNNNNNNVNSPSGDAVSNISSSMEIDNEGFDYVEEDEEDDGNGDCGKKRMRKPVKARSLKSLM